MVNVIKPLCSSSVLISLLSSGSAGGSFIYNVYNVWLTALKSDPTRETPDLLAVFRNVEIKIEHLVEEVSQWNYINHAPSEHKKKKVNVKSCFMKAELRFYATS